MKKSKLMIILLIMFSFLNLVDATSWKNKLTDYNKGLVIEDRWGNQFVWVPIIPGTNDYNSYSFKNESNIYSGKEDMNFDTSAECGGYWVSRYEAGNNSGKVTSKREVPTWTNISYTNAKGAAENFCSANGIDYSEYWKSGLMTGKAWDTMLKWIEKAGYDVNDSRTWGNYNNSILPPGGIGYNPGIKQNTGHNEYWRVKNIYDIAGNISEWTYETNGTNYSYRGGNYSLDGKLNSAANRSLSQQTTSNDHIGFRTQIYLNLSDYLSTYAEENRRYNKVDTIKFDNPTISKGFKPIDVSDAKWKNRASDYNKGLVIEDKWGNQFVWVPIIPGTNDYKNYSFGIAPYYNEDMNFDTSNKYEGFWVARYEAGSSNGKVVSQKGVETWTRVNFVNAKTLSENFCNTNGIDYSNSWKSGLMTGKAWDTMLKWLEKTGYNVNNSTSWGNYADSTHPANVKGYGNKQNTGYSEYWKSNNIYDLAGNVYEWTYETNGFRYRTRGGFYYHNGKDFPVSYRNNTSKQLANGNFGFRIQLYLQ